MELHPHKPGVAGQLHHLHQLPIGGQPGQDKTGPGDCLPEVVVELVAVPVALADLLCLVGGKGPAVPPGEPAGIGPQPHGASLVGDPPLAGHQVNDRVGGGPGELAGVGVRHAADVAGKLHHRHLHPQADAQEGHALLPGIPNGGNFALDPPAAEAAGNQNPIRAIQDLSGVFISDSLAVHPADVHLHPVLNAPMGEGLGHGEIGVVEGHILAHQGDGHLPLRFFGPVDHIAPLGEVGSGTTQPQPPDYYVGQPLPLQHQGRLVEQIGVQIGNDILPGDAAEQGNLVPNLPGDRGVAATDNHIGLDAQRKELLGRVLGGLGLQFPGARDGDDKGDVEKHDIVPAPLRRHLADGLQKGLALDVTHRAANLHNSHIGLRSLQGVDIAFDLVGDVGDDLHRPSQVVSSPLSVQDVPVHLPRRDRGVHRKVFVNKPLVMAQVQVGLRPVVSDKDLPVLIGGHGARVHVEIGVQLLHFDPQPPLLQKPAQAGRGDPLAQAGHHPAGYKNILCHTLHSHSTVAGGLLVMSYTMRLMPATSLTMRVLILSSRS